MSNSFLPCAMIFPGRVKFYHINVNEVMGFNKLVEVICENISLCLVSPTFRTTQ